MPAVLAASSTASTSQVVRPRTVAARVAAPLRNAKVAVGAAVIGAGLSMAGAANASVELVLPSPVYQEFSVDMVVKGLEVKPASEGLQPGTGHHHLVIDAPAPTEGEAIPFDDAHKHFGKGQTTTTLNLTPGKHTITLAFANAKHESYGPDYTATYEVEVLPAPSS